MGRFTVLRVKITCAMFSVVCATGFLSGCGSSATEGKAVGMDSGVIEGVMQLQGVATDFETEVETQSFDMSVYQVGSNGYPIVPYLDIQMNWGFFDGLLSSETDSITLIPNGFYLNGVLVENADLGDMGMMCAKLEELARVCKFNDGGKDVSTSDDFRQLILNETREDGTAVLEFSTLHSEEWYSENSPTEFPRALVLCVYCIDDMLMSTDITLTGCNNYDETDALLIFDDYKVNIINSTVREVGAESGFSVTDYWWSVGGG